MENVYLYINVVSSKIGLTWRQFKSIKDSEKKVEIKIQSINAILDIQTNNNIPGWFILLTHLD